MKTLTALSVAAALALVVVAVAVAGSPAPRLSSGAESGVVYTRGSRSPDKNPSPDLVWHGGPVSHGITVQPIFWGTNWADPAFVNDKVTGLDTFYRGIGGSKYIDTNVEYTDGSGNVSNRVAAGDDLFDTAASLPRPPKTSTILAEVAKLVPNPVPDGYYPVYTDLPPGNAGYCGWHSAGTINGTPVEFAFFFNLDGVSGCDPRDTSGLHSQGLSALANVSGHELSETLTDPGLDAWYDASGAENADKCAWTFNGLESFGGTKWLIQGNWSNAAYDNGQTGYAHGGCVNGNK